MNQKVIIEDSVNRTPEEKINKRIKELGLGWRIISATTAMHPYGIMSEGLCASTGLASDAAQHVYYVTTVVVEKT